MLLRRLVLLLPSLATFLQPRLQRRPHKLKDGPECNRVE
jgi:hypothetical protein